MSIFTLSLSYLTTSSLPWFMDRTFQVPMQYCFLQHWTLLPSSATSTTGCCFCFGSISSFFLDLFLHSYPVEYWTPINLGHSSFSVIQFYLFILFMGFSRQEYWSGLPFPFPVDHILSELSTKGEKEKRRKGRLYPLECRVPKNSKERSESLPQWSMQRNGDKSRMGKTSDLFKKIRDTKKTFHAKMSTIKDRIGPNNTEEIKKRFQKYTEQLYKKDLHVPDNHDCMITHLEPAILECEVKWALGSITMNKASGSDRIPVQFSSIIQLCLTLCNPMNLSTPGLPVHHQLLESTQTHVHWVIDAIQPSHPLPSLLLLPLRWTGWISLQSKGLSRVFSNTTVQKHQFFSSQLSLYSNSHIHTWPLEKPQPWLDGPLLAK